MIPRLCLVTDRRRLAAVAGCSVDAAADRLVLLAAAAAVAGVDVLQVREPDLDARALVTLTRARASRSGSRTCSRSTLRRVTRSERSARAASRFTTPRPVTAPRT